MDIQLRNIRHSPSLSMDSPAFTASLYISGYRAGIVSNHGMGLGTECQPLNSQGEKLMDEAAKWCLTQPPLTCKSPIGLADMELSNTLDHLVYKLLIDHLFAKEDIRFQRRLNNVMQNCIVVGIPDIGYEKYELIMTIEQALAHPVGISRLRETLRAEIIPKMKLGEKVLNTNIPVAILRESGLKEHQYVKENNPSITQTRKNENRIKGH